ncbi:MAG: hypothetical protein EOO09_21530 [Chitinophagaceae bacterium]|nr:MAG: hypothetical protein EOO09_21530 [Chitinophagaceae bacterium]
MTPRSLFIIILKVFGIFLLQSLVTQGTLAIYQIFSMLTLTLGDALAPILVTLLSFGVILWVCYWLLFKPGELVTRFALDQHFKEEKLELNISMESVLRIALIVTGAIILFLELPDLIQRIYERFNVVRFFGDHEPDWSPIIISGLRILLALLIIGERNRILDLLQKKEIAVPPAGDKES